MVAAALKPIFVSALVGILELIVKTSVRAAAATIVTVIITVGKRGSERRAQCERGCRQDYLMHAPSPIEAGSHDCGQLTVAPGISSRPVKTGS